MNYGDNVDDEWYAVRVMLNLTKRFPAVAVQVSDSSDGEIILIEAADHIPDWLSPDNCDNRVFLQGGAVHIVEPSGGSPETLTLRRALEAVFDPAKSTIADVGVQLAVQDRANSIGPETVLHRAPCIVPLSVARLIKTYPALALRAVEAFSSDTSSASVCNSLSKFPTSATCVLSAVPFTKCAYLKISQCEGFQPPKKSFSSVEVGDIVRLCESPGHAHLKGALDLGVKVTCGFEMLYQKWRKINEKLKKVVPKNEEEWEMLEKKMTGKKGDWAGGSTGAGGVTMADLRTVFLALYAEMRADVTVDQLIDEELGKKMQTEAEAEAGEQEKAFGVPPRADEVDNDEWTKTTLEDFEAKLRNVVAQEQSSGKGGGRQDDEEGDDEKSAAEKFDGIAKGMKKFFSGKADVEGVATGGGGGGGGGVDDVVVIDPDKFLRILEQVVGGAAQVDGKKKTSDGELFDDDEDDEDDDDDDSDNDVCGGRAGGDGNVDDHEPGTQQSMHDIMTAMDSELKLADDKTSKREDETGDAGGHQDDDEDVNVDVRVVSNLLESLLSAEGTTGPASVMLSELGLHLDKVMPPPLPPRK